MPKVKLTEGRTRTDDLARRYTPVGVAAENALLPAHRIRLAVFGESGVGKTHFIMSRPRVAVVNFDKTVCTHASPGEGCEVFPGPGEPVNWEQAEAYVEAIIQAKQKGLEGVPEVIALDSYNSMLNVARTYVAYKMYAAPFERPRGEGRTPTPPPKSLDQFNVFDVAAQHGQKVWGMTYLLINEMIETIHSAGLGVILSLHLERIVDRETGVATLATSMNNNQWNYLKPIIDSSVMLTKDSRPVAETVKKTITVGGRELERNETVTRMMPRQTLHTYHGQLGHLIKTRTRVGLPAEIDVTTGGFPAFAKVYDNADPNR